jgi:hypothetical protein
MAKLRPYRIVWKGVPYMVEARDAATAAAWVVGIEVSELRAATPSEVSAWCRAGNDIPVAGEAKARAGELAAAGAVDEEAIGSDVVEGRFNATDARTWLLAEIDAVRPKLDPQEQATALSIFDRMREHEAMDATDYRAMVHLLPTFSKAMRCQSDERPWPTPENFADELEAADGGMMFGDVVGQIARYVEATKEG